MPMKTRQTMKTIKDLGKIIIQVGMTTREQPQYQTSLLPNLSDVKPPTKEETNVPIQKHD